MHWLNYAFGSRFVDWLALAVVVVLTFAIRIGARRFISQWLTHKRDKGKSERDHWCIHGGAGPVESVVLSGNHLRVSGRDFFSPN
jgi:hypothetical protein